MSYGLASSSSANASEKKKILEKPPTVLYCYLVGVAGCCIFCSDFHLPLLTYLSLVWSNYQGVSSFDLFLSSAWGKCTVPWPSEMAHRGISERDLSAPPPDGVAIGGHGGIYSNKVGSNVRPRWETVGIQYCSSHISLHVTQVRLTPITTEINIMPQTTSRWIDLIVYCGAKTLNSRVLELPLHYALWLHPTSQNVCGYFPIGLFFNVESTAVTGLLDFHLNSIHSRSSLRCKISIMFLQHEISSVPCISTWTSGLLPHRCPLVNTKWEVWLVFSALFVCSMQVQ